MDDSSVEPPILVRPTHWRTATPHYKHYVRVSEVASTSIVRHIYSSKLAKYSPLPFGTTVGTSHADVLEF